MQEYGIIIAGIGLLAFCCQWIAWWVRLPAILFLLLTGIVIGPGLHWLEPDKMFGALLKPLIMLSVAVILFEGSLTLNFNQIREQRKVVRNLVSLGLLITAALTAFFTHWIVKFDWPLSALFGAITAVTGPTVIAPMLRTVRPTQSIAHILRWESIIIDPIGALLAVLVFGLIASSQGKVSLFQIAAHFGEMIIVSSVLGVVAAHWLGVALRNHYIPHYLHNVATLIIVLALFTLSNRIGNGTGLLTVTLMGIYLANMPRVPVEELLGFKESLSILLISGLFIILAARIQLSHLHELWQSALLLLIPIQFIARPLSVAVCTLGSKLTWQERTLIAWMSPRGIVAASVAAIFGLRIQQLGYSAGPHLVLLTFLIIIGTVVFQSLTSRGVARLLKVTEPEPTGVLIIGANIVARALGKALQQHGFRVLLTGPNWDNIHLARMEGLPSFFGNPISTHAERHIDLIGMGYLLALTPQTDLNLLATLCYRRDFQSDHLLTIQTAGEKLQPSNSHRILFRDPITYSTLAELLHQGAEIHSSTLRKNFDFKSFQIQHPDRIPLFAITPRKQLKFFTAEHALHPGTDWIIIGIDPR